MALLIPRYAGGYYNPTDARWTQLEPSGQDKGYAYTADNPVNYTDPSGYLNTNLNALAGAVVYGCAVGVTSSLAVALATSLATGGTGAPYLLPK